MTNAPTIQQKWTPGPWHVERHQLHLPSSIPTSLVVREEPEHPELRTPIAEVTVSTEADANARLIAAAPEMYDLLDESMTDLNCVRAPERAAPRLQCDCWKCVFANRVYALMKRIKGEE